MKNGWSRAHSARISGVLSILWGANRSRRSSLETPSMEDEPRSWLSRDITSIWSGKNIECVRFRLMKEVAYFLLILNRASFLEAAGVVLKIGLSLKPVVKHWSKEMNDSWPVINITNIFRAAFFANFDLPKIYKPRLLDVQNTIVQKSVRKMLAILTPVPPNVDFCSCLLLSLSQIFTLRQLRASLIFLFLSWNPKDC